VVNETKHSAETVAGFKRLRDELTQSVLRQQQAYDQTVLKLAAAGLGLTVTLATALITADEPIQHRFPLLLAWLFLSGSLASVIFSFVTSQKESKKRIILIDKKKFKEAIAPELTRLTLWLNYCSGGFLVAGGLFLALFITLNV
jgi:hypothetical protein